ncbi:MAG: hypothetical protein ABJA89_01940 [Lapillicoccus sp.]
MGRPCRRHVGSSHPRAERGLPRPPRPEHYLSLNVFPDADAAAANSALPETDAMASEVARLVTDLTYTDLDVVMSWSSADEVAAAFLRFG